MLSEICHERLSAVSADTACGAMNPAKQEWPSRICRRFRACRHVRAFSAAVVGPADRLALRHPNNSRRPIDCPRLPNNRRWERRHPRVAASAPNDGLPDAAMSPETPSRPIDDKIGAFSKTRRLAAFIFAVYRAKVRASLSPAHPLSGNQLRLSNLAPPTFRSREWRAVALS